MASRPGPISTGWRCPTRSPSSAIPHCRCRSAATATECRSACRSSARAVAMPGAARRRRTRIPPRRRPSHRSARPGSGRAEGRPADQCGGRLPRLRLERDPCRWNHRSVNHALKQRAGAGFREPTGMETALMPAADGGDWHARVSAIASGPLGRQRHSPVSGIHTPI